METLLLDLEDRFTESVKRARRLRHKKPRRCANLYLRASENALSAAYIHRDLGSMSFDNIMFRTGFACREASAHSAGAAHMLAMGHVSETWSPAVALAGVARVLSLSDPVPPYYKRFVSEHRGIVDGWDPHMVDALLSRYLDPEMMNGNRDEVLSLFEGFRSRPSW